MESGRKKPSSKLSLSSEEVFDTSRSAARYLVEGGKNKNVKATKRHVSNSTRADVESKRSLGMRLFRTAVPRWGHIT